MRAALELSQQQTLTAGLVFEVHPRDMKRGVEEPEGTRGDLPEPKGPRANATETHTDAAHWRTQIARGRAHEIEFGNVFENKYENEFEFENEFAN